MFSAWKAAPELYVENIYVKQEHRNRGLGKKFSAEMAAVARDKGCARIEWKTHKDNAPGIAFYENALEACRSDTTYIMRIEPAGYEGIIERFGGL
ncbi:hypothetical protein L202_00224 [Cryptococcus amylolentus CBS 6039]|uniref:N-acetyltransferase domain-containing protein n=2 Tax=Cryptococcus amylolentus TaxID=104669 RepID=A0A1E3I8Q5_9TREE|nr:hypothetical protein L202_00224 [Cryptococcus amylolentus CBS 6039]ODN84226.1 hypothetical protein L202_00224 [Cryptococcus amylolentus CBS 6039]ODO11921.1 hypothetical protein I350_00705 [Cryptococcus amylolentus CBS 6273]